MPKKALKPDLSAQLRDLEERFDKRAEAADAKAAQASEALASARQTAADGLAALEERLESDDGLAAAREIVQEQAALTLLVSRAEKALAKAQQARALVDSHLDSERRALVEAWTANAPTLHESLVARLATAELGRLEASRDLVAIDVMAGDCGARPVSSDLQAAATARVDEALAPVRAWLTYDALVSALREREHGPLRTAAEAKCQEAIAAAVAKVAPIDPAVKQAYFFARHGEATYPALLDAFKSEKARVEADERAAREPHEQELRRTLAEIDGLPLTGAPKPPSCPRPEGLESWAVVLGRPSVALPPVASEPEPVAAEPEADDPEPILPRQWLPAAEWLNRHSVGA